MAKYDSFRFKNKKIIVPEAKIRSWVADNFEFRERKNGEWLLICSPFTEDTDFKMGINVKTGIVNYWPGNEWAGPVSQTTGKRNRSFLNFVRIYLNCTFSSAVARVLGGEVAYEKDSRTAPVYDILQVKLPLTAKPFTENDDKITSGLFKWLQSRGYSRDEVINHNLHYTPSLEVIWPYFEFEELVYWQSRSRLNKVFRFPPTNVQDRDGNITAKSESSKGDFLYGFDDVEPASYLIITEAIFDQHTIGAQALASGGAVLTQNQLKKIKLLGPKKGIILAPDNDKAGISSVISNSDLLAKIGYKVFYALPPSINYGDGETTKDWNELFSKLKMPKSDIRKVLDDGIKPVNSQTIIALRSQTFNLQKKVWRK